jgi:hypothetical protein
MKQLLALEDAALDSPPQPVDQAAGSEWTRRRFLGTGVGTTLGAVGVLGALESRADVSTFTPLDVAFIQIGDPHYRSDDTVSSNHNLTLRDNLRRLMALTPSSTMPGAGTLGTPRGVLNCGDLLESGTVTPLTKTQTLEAQWVKYVADFGLLGNEAGTIIKYPVYESYGNHDQDGFLKQVSDRIAARAAQLPNITAVSGSYTYVGSYGNITVKGVHFAWMWSGIHFVNCNMRSGSDGKRYPSSNSYGFLKDYLEQKVKTSNDPVFVMVHLPPTTGAEGDWPLVDRQAFYDLLIQYNTVGILVGHVHSYAYFQWRGPDNLGAVPIPVYQCDAIQRSSLTQGIFTAFRILGSPTDSTKATVHMAQRLRNNTWGNSNSRQITLGTSAINSPPSFAGFSGTTAYQTTLSIPLASLLAQASDADSDPLSLTAAGPASEAGGSAALQATAVLYTPPAGFSGQDSFPVTLSDGRGGLTLGTVTVSIGAAPNPATLPEKSPVITTVNGNQVQLSMTATPGGGYLLQRSLDDMLSWQTIRTLTADSNGYVQWTDPGTYPSAYYRFCLP